MDVEGVGGPVGPAAQRIMIDPDVLQELGWALVPEHVYREDLLIRLASYFRGYAIKVGTQAKTESERARRLSRKGRNECGPAIRVACVPSSGDIRGPSVADTEPIGQPQLVRGESSRDHCSHEVNWEKPTPELDHLGPGHRRLEPGSVMEGRVPIHNGCVVPTSRDPHPVAEVVANDDSLDLESVPGRGAARTRFAEDGQPVGKRSVRMPDNLTQDEALRDVPLRGQIGHISEEESLKRRELISRLLCHRRVGEGHQGQRRPEYGCPPPHRGDSRSDAIRQSDVGPTYASAEATESARIHATAHRIPSDAHRKETQSVSSRVMLNLILHSSASNLNGVPPRNWVGFI